MLKKIITFALCGLCALSGAAVAVNTSADKTPIDGYARVAAGDENAETATNAVPTVTDKNAYRDGVVYETKEIGNGFAFSVNALPSPAEIEGNGIGIRLYNGNKIPVKLKLGVSAGDNPDGSDAAVYQTLGSRGKNKNFALYSDGKRTYIESRSGIVEIPAYFDGVLFMPYERFGSEAAPQGYISQFRFGCALCDVASSYVALYEIFDTIITDGADEDGNLDYNACGVRIIKSLGNASELKPQNDVFWGGYSYESGAEAAARRAHDKSVTEISVLQAGEIRTAEYREKWIGDVKILESFDNISADGEITEENAGYIRTGAPATLYAAPFDGGYSLGVKVGDYATEFDGAKFVNVTIPAVNANWRDWSGANGFTMRVKNNGDKFVNMNVEFFGVEPSGAQFRWCMSFIGSRVYALDTNTGEEWSFISGSRLYIPPAFNGWIRIPFTQFRPNGGVAPFSNVLNLDYPVAGLYLTSSIVDNSGAELAFDDIGLYYGDFGAASVFENTVTIRDLLNAHDYKEKYL